MKSADSVLLLLKEKDEAVATQAEKAASIDIVVVDDEEEEEYGDDTSEGEEKEEASRPTEPDDDAVVVIPEVTEAVTVLPHPDPVAVSPESIKIQEPADPVAAVPDPTPSQEPSVSEDSETESIEVEIQQISSIVDIVKRSTADERDAVLDAWGLSQEQLDKQQAQETAATKDKKKCLQELVLCYDPSIEFIPPALGSLQATAESTTDDQLAAKSTKPSSKSEENWAAKEAEKKTADSRVEKIQSTQTKKPRVVTAVKETAEAAAKSPMSEAGSVVSNGSVKAKVAMWESKIREVPFDEPPVVSPTAQQSDDERKEQESFTSQATPEHSNLANACAASIVEGTQCAPADTTVSFDDTNIGPMMSLLDKEDDDSQVALREVVVSAPSDEDQARLSKTDAARKVSTEDGGTEVDESLEIELAVEQDGTIGDVACGASTLSGDVITYLFSPRNAQLIEETLCCSPRKASDTIINTEGAPKLDVDFPKNDFSATDK